MLLAFSSYRRAVPNMACRLLNVYAEQNPAGAKSPFFLNRMPGVAAWRDVGTGPGRGMGIHKGVLYAVSGTKLHRVSGAQAEVGNIPGVQRCSLASNGLVLCVVANPKAYTFDGAATTEITDADFTARGAAKVGFIDGYFAFLEPNTGRFFSSDLYSTAFDALKFATAEGAPDNLIDLIVNQRQVFLLGKQSSELYWNSGAANFPFEAVSGGFLEKGGIGGLAKSDNAEHWFANDKTVRALRGNVAGRVSNHGIEEAIRTHTSIPTGFGFEMEGHEFYVLRFDEACYVRDAGTQEWTERASFNSPTWRVIDVIELDGTYYAQDKTTGAVGILDPTCFTEWGETLRTEVTSPPVWVEGRWVFHQRLELHIKTGVGLAVGQGSVPTIMCEYSDDGGDNWYFAPSKGLGPIGNSMYRVFWTDLGRAIQRVYRFTTSDPVAVQMMAAHIDYEVGERAA